MNPATQQDLAALLAEVNDELDPVKHEALRKRVEDAVAALVTDTTPNAIRGDKGAEAVVLTPAMLADAFGCFWNAAIGCDAVRHDSTAFATVAGMAQGFAAIEARLRDLAAPTQAAAKDTKK